MKSVSDQYRAAIQRHREYGVRNPMHAQISFGLFDATAQDDATVITSAMLPYASKSGLETGENTITESYATWEQDYFRLDGSQYFLPTSDFKEQGFISTAISNDDGEFTSNPYIDIAFTTLHSMVGVTLQFDTVTETFPTDFNIEIYEGGTLKKTVSVTDNTDVVFKDEIGIEEADRIRIVFLKTRPHNRIRANSLVYGIAYLFGDQELMQIQHNRSTNAISMELPSESLVFTAFNGDGLFDIDASNSMVAFLREGQQVTVRYGCEIDSDGTIEWPEGFTYWLESWETSGTSATFTCRDIFSQLLMTTYKKGILDTQMHRLIQLAIDVLQDSGITDYWVYDYGLQITWTNLPLQYVSHAENLQLIANMGRSSLEQSPSGGIIMRYREQIPQEDMRVESYGELQTVFSYYADDDAEKGGVLDGTETPDYATWEEDFFALDGSMRFLPPSGPYVNSGYVSDVFPNESGNYPAGPYDDWANIEIDFTRNITFGSVEIDLGETSSTDGFFIRGMRNAASEPGITVLQEVMGKYVNGTWKDGKLVIEDNFDRIVRLHIICMHNPKHQRGRIKRVKINYPMAFELTNDDVIGSAMGELLPKCRNVIYNTLHFATWAGTPNEPIQTVTVEPNILTELKHDEIYYAQRFECDDPNVVIEQEEHYAYCSFIKISGVTTSAEIKWYANTFANSYTVPYTSSIWGTGEDYEITNPIVSDEKFRVEIADWIADYMSKQHQYTLETLGYPEIDPGDLITYNGKEATVVEANISFKQGAMRETFILRGETKNGDVANAKNRLENTAG